MRSFDLDNCLVGFIGLPFMQNWDSLDIVIAETWKSCCTVPSWVVCCCLCEKITLFCKVICETAKYWQKNLQDNSTEMAAECLWPASPRNAPKVPNHVYVCESIMTFIYVHMWYLYLQAHKKVSKIKSVHLPFHVRVGRNGSTEHLISCYFIHCK